MSVVRRKGTLGGDKDYDPSRKPMYEVKTSITNGGLLVQRTDQFWLLYADSTGSAALTGEYKLDAQSPELVERRREFHSRGRVPCCYMWV